MLNQATIARIEAQIEKHFDHPIRGELSPAKSDSKAKKASYSTRMERWNEQLDVMTAELRALKTASVEVKAERVFPNDIANAEALAVFEYHKQRQLEGVLRSCGHKPRFSTPPASV